MSKKTNLKPIAAAIGATFAVSLLSPIVGATENPFNMNDLAASGYMVADHAAEGKCGEEKATTEGTEEAAPAGDDKDTSAEGKCGEGKCGEQRKAHEGKCGEDKAKTEGEGKCGEEKK